MLTALTTSGSLCVTMSSFVCQNFSHPINLHPVYIDYLGFNVRIHENWLTCWTIILWSLLFFPGWPQSSICSFSWSENYWLKHTCLSEGTCLSPKRIWYSNEHFKEVFLVMANTTMAWKFNGLAYWDTRANQLLWMKNHHKMYVKHCDLKCWNWTEALQGVKEGNVDALRWHWCRTTRPRVSTFWKWQRQTWWSHVDSV